MTLFEKIAATLVLAAALLAGAVAGSARANALLAGESPLYGLAAYLAVALGALAGACGITLIWYGRK